MNKKNHLKPAFILCGIVAVVIVILFVLAGNVNKNVVKNMTGKILYTEDGSQVRQYNFDDGTDTLISGNIGNARCGNYAGTGILFAGTDEKEIWNIYVHNSYTEENTVIYTMPENAELIDLTAREQTFAAAYESDGNYFIITYDIEKETETQAVMSDREIYSVCLDEECSIIYYTQADGSDCILKSVSISGENENELLKGENERITYIAFRDDTLYMCEEKDNNSTISQYNLNGKTATTLKFSSEEYNCVSICPVYDKEYIVSSDKDGAFAVYVCNGSNMVKADDAGNGKDCFVTSYVNTDK